MKATSLLIAIVFAATSVRTAEFEQTFFGQANAGFNWADPQYNHFASIAGLVPGPADEYGHGSASLRWMTSLTGDKLRAELHLQNSLVNDHRLGPPGKGNTAPGFRSALLQRHWIARRETRGFTEIDYAFITAEAGLLKLKVGRQPINLAKNFYFAVTDYFSPFSSSDFQRLYKQGVDAARLTLALGELSEFEIITVLGYEPTDPADNPRKHAVLTGGPQGLTSYIGRLVRTINSIEIGIMGGHIPYANIAAGWLTRDLGKNSLLTLECTWAVPEGSFANSGSGYDASMGLSTQWAPELNTRLELLIAQRQPYNPSPLAIKSESTAFAFSVNREINPLTQGAFLLMFDPDHTALFMNLTRSLSDESDISLDLTWPLAGRSNKDLGQLPFPSEAADYLRGPLANSPARVSLDYRHFF